MSQQPDLFEPRPSREPHVFTVREITDAARRLLDDSFGEVVIEGEVSNAKQHPSGHWYLTLKDEAAQIAAVLFRSDAATLRFQLENGMHVRVFGRLSVYAPQGRFQVLVRSIVPVGQGVLELAFRQLMARLQAEGLFDPARKRPLPRFPRRIALVTSPSGAALHDMLSTLRAHWPPAHVLLVPVAVQGETAPAEIVHALQLLDHWQAADVIITGRGGGSLEDLWAFNDERVARAIVASSIPVVSAVGHEVDFTIADWVADVRAATPTAAAALVVPHRDEVRVQVLNCQKRLVMALRRQIDLRRQRLDAALGSYGLRRPQLLIVERMQTLDLRRERLRRAVLALLERRNARFGAAIGRLQALSPRAILERGFTYCVDAASGHVVARAAHTRPGQDLRLQFADGARPARILPPAAAPREEEA